MSLPLEDLGQATIGDSTIADRPVGWASIEDEPAGSATIVDEPEWRSPDSESPQRQASAADAPWWTGAADEQSGHGSTSDAAPGRVAVFDKHSERSEQTAVPGDVRIRATVGEGRAAHAKPDASRNALPTIVVAPNPGEPTQTLPSRRDPTSPESRGGLPLISSLNDRIPDKSAASDPAASDPAASDPAASDPVVTVPAATVPVETGTSAVTSRALDATAPVIVSKTTRQTSESSSSVPSGPASLDIKVVESDAGQAEDGDLGQESGPANAAKPFRPRRLVTTITLKTTLHGGAAKPTAKTLVSESDTEPLTTESLTTEPLTTESLTTEPLTTKSLTTEPRATEPRATEPRAVPSPPMRMAADPSKQAGNLAACCDEDSLADSEAANSEAANSEAAERSETKDAAAQPGWVALDLSSETGRATIDDRPPTVSSVSVSDGRLRSGLPNLDVPDVEGWKPHPTAKLVELVPTAAAPELLPAETDGGYESLPSPPRRLGSVVPVSGETGFLSDTQHLVPTLSEGPALRAPEVAPEGSPDRVSAGMIALSTLLSDDAKHRKGSGVATTNVTSPRRVTLFDADDPPAFEPPPTPGGAEPPEPGNGGPVELAPLLAPANNTGETPALAGPQLSGPGPGNAPQGRAGSDEQKLGKAPEDTSLRFLRQQTVLLKPGEMQFDISLQYLNDKVDFVGVQQDNGLIQIAEAQRRQRLLMMPMQLRVGIVEYTQAFVNVPLGVANSESAFLGQDQATTTGGIGDVSAGVIKQLIVGNEYYPDVLASVSFSAPTGESNFLTALTTPGSNLGEGFWSLTSAITFIQNYDPVVLFYGGGYRHRFQEKFNGTTKVTPGSQFIYRFGLGFAVNPNVTLSASFNGSFIGELEVNGENVGGSAQEPMQVRLAATINKRKLSKTHSSVQLVEPFVTFGLNDDAIDTIIGVTWTF